MTAIAPAPSHPAIPQHTGLPAHAAPPPPAGLLSFVAVLDSMPAAKARPPAGEQTQTPADSPPRERPQPPMIPNPSFLNAALTSAPLVAAPAPTPAAKPEGPVPAPASAAEMKAPAPDVSAPRLHDPASVPNAVGARLTGERAFHASVAVTGAAILPASPGAPAPASEEPPLANSATAAFEAAAPLPPNAALVSPCGEAPYLPPAGPPSQPESNATRADRTPAPPSGEVSSGLVPGQAHQSAGRRSSEQSSEPVAVTAPRRGAAPEPDKAPSKPNASRTAQAPAPDAGGPAGLARSGSVDAQPPPSLALPAGPLTALPLTDQPARIVEAPANAVAPRSIPAPQSSGAPVREIDVDLSPGGLEDVSMTMRLSGDKLSLVIRAASSQTAGTIEGARDAIAERLAAIGQPLGSLIIQQTGSSDGANAKGSSTGEGDGGGRPQGRGSDPNDPRGARRGGSPF
jgi:hypothetical protein